MSLIKRVRQLLFCRHLDEFIVRGPGTNGDIVKPAGWEGLACPDCERVTRGWTTGKAA